eukprot:12132210-Ditylum_brightwellii.AAC.1
MESISMLPPHCDGVILVAWGEPCVDVTESLLWFVEDKDATWLEVRELYHGMKLVLNQYEELAA